MLTLHRRHLASCDHAAKGWNYTLCDCPIWCDGKLDGRRIRRSLDTTSWDRATRRAHLWQTGGDLPPGGEPAGSSTIAGAAKAFLADCQSRNLRQSTIASYTRSLNHLADGVGKDAEVRAIDLAVLDRYRATRTVEPRTWRKELEHLRAFFAFCLDRNWCPKNPAKKIRMPRVDDLATLPFTADEVQRLIAACDQIASDNPATARYIRHRARALVYALLYSGLRIIDVAKLRRAALDETTRHLTLRVTKTGGPLKVQLHPDAAETLKTLAAQHPDFFFWTGRGNPERCAKNMWRTIQRLGALAKIDNAHPHRFRDTFAVELLTGGADIRTVQMLLGHKSVRTTEKHYAHFVAAHQALLDSATARLDFTPKAARPVLVRPRQQRRRNA